MSKAFNKRHHIDAGEAVFFCTMIVMCLILVALLIMCFDCCFLTETITTDLGDGYVIKTDIYTKLTSRSSSRVVRQAYVLMDSDEVCRVQMSGEQWAVTCITDRVRVTEQYKRTKIYGMKIEDKLTLQKIGDEV